MLRLCLTSEIKRGRDIVFSLGAGGTSFVSKMNDSETLLVLVWLAYGFMTCFFILDIVIVRCHLSRCFVLEISKAKALPIVLDDPDTIATGLSRPSLHTEFTN